MAGRIKLLPDSVANQIAAGEVVNRPASVVKEIMENAVDAGAGSITVNFRDGGRELIQIKDDGCGMSPQDARLAFERHATSKIAAVDDIYSLMTFGFRGEALASIAAVSQVELQTREKGEEVGTKLLIDGGTFRDQSAAAVSEGTQIFIRNLFYNVPVRKRFLDKGTTEAAHITAEFQRVALCHPEISFQLYRDDAQVYNLPAASLLQRIIGIMGKSIGPKLVDVSVHTSIIRISGFIGRPASARQRNKEQFLFVNGRYFKSAFFHKAVLQAYDKLIPATVQSSYFLYLDIDPESIDVNVHPQKTEVKFSNQSAIWQIINAAVRESLAKSGAVPLMDFDSEERIEIPVLGRDMTPVREPSTVRSHDYNPFTKYEAGGTSDYAMRQSQLEESRMVYDKSEFEYIPSGEDAVQSTLTSLGENKTFTASINIGDGYAAAVYGGIFVIVDLRRAREAVLFDRINRMLTHNQSATQQLLFPERMVLSADDFTLLKDQEEEFRKFGFDLRFSAEHAVEIAGTPADLPAERLDEVIYDMLDALREDLFTAEEARREKLAAIMARAGTGTAPLKLPHEETANLLASLAETSNPSYTPWGKPVMAEVTSEEIKNRLK